MWVEHGIRADVPSLLLAIEKKAQFADPTADVPVEMPQGEAEGEAEETPKKPTRRTTLYGDEEVLEFPIFHSCG